MVEGEGPNLPGHDWLETLQVRLNAVYILWVPLTKVLMKY